ncbi:prepilin-type N-terminal cleavage/methylation domain-containing protein [Caloramator quimbayensis]|uniref:Prepilin-type N-terminal cleavage/methylation domain-containing protein n=1 Tax=Caloramator quimbayensis TaxID=1147123 RepID=A0A1T4WWR4_9CLOT|nr:type II secretion system protein [Caloramator quimbayensis]SKA81812.1 prepilin-type N-terminal cleavage/methylation domain-containing protein [Caloramator quimbayensis]
MKIKRKGFTLIEVLSVIAILGIIMSIVVPRIGNYNKSAKKAMFLSDAKTIMTAIELYNVEAEDLIYDSDTIDEVKAKLLPEGDESKKYLNNWPSEFPRGVETVGDLKGFIQDPNKTAYYERNTQSN